MKLFGGSEGRKFWEYCRTDKLTTFRKLRTFFFQRVGLEGFYAGSGACVPGDIHIKLQKCSHVRLGIFPTPGNRSQTPPHSPVW